MATPQQRSRVESLLGIRMPKRPTPTARKPAPPVVERRAAPQVEPEAPPAKRTNTIKALVVDPAKRTVKETKLRTEPGDEGNGYGVQIAEGEAEKIVGVDELESLDLASGDVVVIDPAMQGEMIATWALGDEPPVAGVGIVLGYDSEADAYSDATMSLDEARKSITWGDEDSEGARVELIAKIADRLEALDAKQLKKVQATIDEIEGAEAGAADADEREEDAELGSSSYRDNRY